MPKEKLSREKQFMPFNALKGYQELLREKEVEHEERVELSEEKQQEINEILIGLKRGDKIKINFYINGRYLTRQGMIQKLSFVTKILVVNNKMIYFKDIRDIKLID